LSSLRPTERLIEHVTAQRFERLPPSAVAAAKSFIQDSLGVALAGTRVPGVRELLGMAARSGAGSAARIFGTGERVPAPTAAMINAYQIHNVEFDCVHEPAVVHPMAAVLATLLAWAEERGEVSGRSLITACSAAVDVATTIGAAARNPLRFFRPAMCGALGATAGIAVLEQLPPATLWSALGLCYSQLSGTMQAHIEGSPVLPMQIGFNTRAAITAIDLARRGVQGPRDFLEGPFGYFSLIDPQWDPAGFADLGSVFRITELSHKPFPSGRATHGGIDGVLTLKAAHGFTAEDVETVTVRAPPLVLQLVDRPAHADMAPSYARLCGPYVVATALLEGGVGVLDFEAAAIADPRRLTLAARVHLVDDGNPSRNALVPQRVEVRLKDGRALALDLTAVLGAPGRPLGREGQLAKFRAAAASGMRPLPPARVAALEAEIESLELLVDLRALVDLLMF
jgi:2-methylcitrate dehydratase PrpD